MPTKSYKTATKPKATTPKPKVAPRVISTIQFSSNTTSDKVLLCGPSKAGKTFFSCSYPGPFVLNFDKGLATVRSKNVPFFKFIRMTKENKLNKTVEEKDSKGEVTHAYVSKYKTILEILTSIKYQEGAYWEMIKESGIDFKTLIIDSFSSMSQLMESELIIMPTNGIDRKEILQFQDYNLIKRRILGIVDILMEMPYNIIGIAGIELYTSETGAFLDHPSMTGRNLGSALPYPFDEVYYQNYDESKGVWTLSPIKSKRFVHAGTRVGLEMRTYENPTYEKLKRFKK